MAASKIPMGLVLVLVITMFTTRAMAQSGCTSVLIGMASCLNYVTGSSTTPSSSCCSALAGVVKSQPKCLCTALSGGGGSVLGININQTLALALPAACKVQTPPVSRCSGGNGPALSPVSSPETSPGDFSDETPDSPGASLMPGGGSKTVPGNGATVPENGATSNGSTIKMSLQLIAVLLFMASYASTYSSSL